VIVRRLAVALALGLSACQVHIAHFTAIGNPIHDAAEAPRGEPIHGETCRWWVLGVTLGLPRIEDAVADALEHAGTNGVVRDVDLVSVHPVYGPAGQHCYLITNTPTATGAGW
jgi:hypothetical protein